MSHLTKLTNLDGTPLWLDLVQIVAIQWMAEIPAADYRPNGVPARTRIEAGDKFMTYLVLETPEQIMALAKE